MFENEFTQMLSKYPDALSDKKRFSGIMRDFFPGQQMRVNLMTTAYELGIATDIAQATHINNAFAFRYVKRLVDEYGVSRLNADWAVSVWCVCYGSDILHKRCDIKISQAKTGAAPAIKEERTSDAGKQYGDLFRYTKLPDGYGVLGFSGSNKKTIIFSNTYNGQPVKKIMQAAFMECEVQEAVMTTGIEAIEDDAFKGCTDLKQVIFSYSLKEIGANAFAGCKNLITAALPNGIEQIGKYAFANTGFKTVTFPKTIYWFGEGAYSNCSRLDNITLPDNIISVPDRMFQGCTGLTTIKLPDTIDTIGNNAFEGCSSLQTIAIPESVKTIGENAFANVHPKFTMLCYRLSPAEQYARKNNIKFQIIY